MLMLFLLPPLIFRHAAFAFRHCLLLRQLLFFSLISFSFITPLPLMLLLSMIRHVAVCYTRWLLLAMLFADYVFHVFRATLALPC